MELLPLPNSDEQKVNSFKQFLDRCGLDTSHFPTLKFLFEIPDKQLKTHRICIPLRLPNHGTDIYETFFRITRVLEIPVSQGKGHRNFIEVEWVIEPEPFDENELHPANSFLASEMSCPSCRIHFAADPTVISDQAVRISCPQCLHQWVCKIDSNMPEGRLAPLFLDLIQKDPQELGSLLSSWEEKTPTTDDAFFHGFFPYEFESMNNASALEWFFEDVKGWITTPTGPVRNFENLMRCFLNKISLHYLKQYPLSSQVDLAEKTDVKKSVSSVEQSLLEEKPLDELLPTAQAPKAVKPPETKDNLYGSSAPEAISHSFTWQPQELTQSKRITVRKKIPRRSKVFSAIAAGLAITIGSIFTAQFWLSSTPKEEAISAKQAPLPIAQVPEVTEPAPLANEQKVEPVAATENIQEAAAPSPQPSAKQEVDTPKTSVEILAKKEVKPQRSISTAKMESENTLKKLRQSLVQEEKSAPKAEAKELTNTEKIDSSYRQAMLHLKLQQGKEAASQFETIIKLDPANAPSYRGLGLAYYYNQQYDLAVRAFENYLKLSTESRDRSSVEEMVRVLREKLATASLTR